MSYNILIEVPPKTLAKRKKIEEVKPVSGLDIEALLAKGKAAETSPSKRQKVEVRIGLDDPAKDFKKLIDNEENSWKPGPFLISRETYISLQGNGECYQEYCFQILCRFIISKSHYSVAGI